MFLLLFHARFEGDFFCVFLIFHDFCKMCFVSLESLCLIAHAQNGELDDLIALGNGVDHVLIFFAKHLAEYGVFTVEPRGGLVGDEKLAAICAGTGVSHGENAGPHVFEGRINLIDKAITRTARAGAERATALDHKVGDHPMKPKPVVVRLASFAALSLKFLSALCQAHKVGYSQWSFLKLEFQSDGAFCGLEPSIKAIGKVVLGHR